MELIIKHLDWYNVIKDPQAWAENIIKSVVAFLSLKAVPHLTLMLTTDKEQQQLNHDFRGRKSSTNVLAFPCADPIDEEYIGDISLALETCLYEAGAQGKKFIDHASHLLIHGILHLLGFDHKEEGEADIMETIEINVLKQLGIDNPYT